MNTLLVTLFVAAIMACPFQLERRDVGKFLYQLGYLFGPELTAASRNPLLDHGFPLRLYPTVNSFNENGQQYQAEIDEDGEYHEIDFIPREVELAEISTWMQSTSFFDWAKPLFEDPQFCRIWFSDRLTAKTDFKYSLLLWQVGAIDDDLIVSLMSREESTADFFLRLLFTLMREMRCTDAKMKAITPELMAMRLALDFPSALELKKPTWYAIDPPIFTLDTCAFFSKVFHLLGLEYSVELMYQVGKFLAGEPVDTTALVSDLLAESSKQNDFLLHQLLGAQSSDPSVVEKRLSAMKGKVGIIYQRIMGTNLTDALQEAKGMVDYVCMLSRVVLSAEEREAKAKELIH